MINTVFCIGLCVEVTLFFAGLVLGFVRAWQIKGKVLTTREEIEEVANKEKLKWSPWHKVGSKYWRHTLFGLGLLLIILNFLK